MSLFKKFLKSTEKSPYDVKKPIAVVDDDEERRRRDDIGRDGTRNDAGEEARRMDGTETVYFALGPPQDRLVEVLKSLNKDAQVRSILAHYSNDHFLSLAVCSSRLLRRKLIVLITSHRLRIKSF